MTTRFLKLTFATDSQADGFDLACLDRTETEDLLLAIEHAIAKHIACLDCPVGRYGVQASIEEAEGATS